MKHHYRWREEMLHKESSRHLQKSTLKPSTEYQSVQRVKHHIEQRTATRKIKLPESSKLDNFQSSHKLGFIHILTNKSRKI